MGAGPVPATGRRGFDSAATPPESVDLVELNEAFAVRLLRVLERWKWNDQARLNVNGSGISLGHPIGATGVCIATTLLHELHRRGGGRGLVTMCIGGGQRFAAIVESV